MKEKFENFKEEFKDLKPAFDFSVLVVMTGAPEDFGKDVAAKAKILPVGDEFSKPIRMGFRPAAKEIDPNRGIDQDSHSVLAARISLRSPSHSICPSRSRSFVIS